MESLSSKKYGNIDKLDYYLLAYRIRIELGGERQIMNIASQLSSQPQSKKKDLYLKRIHCYEDLIIENQGNDYVHFLPDDSLLSTIEKNYFIAKNSILNNDVILAKNYFDNVAQYDERLFMVREARRWLADNENAADRKLHSY
ncbi:hypothetical protein [Streptococcus varani]